MKRESRAFLEGAVVGLLVAISLRALLSTLFYLSLATLRLNTTAVWILVLLAPLVALVAPRHHGLLGVSGVAVVALPLARFTDLYVPLAALAAAAGVLHFTQLPREGTSGALVGLGVGSLSLLLGTSLDAALSVGGSVVIGALTLGALVLAPRPVPRERHHAWLGGVAWAALIAVEVAFLASPYTVARNVGVGAAGAGVAGLVGLVVGVAWLSRASRAAIVVVAAVGAFDVAVTRSPVALASLVALQAALGAAGARLPRPHPVAFAPTLTALLFGLVFFGSTLGDTEWRVALPLLALTPVVVALRERNDAARPAPRRAALPLALAALLAIPGLAMPHGAPLQDDDGTTITVVNWNVHQGFGNRGALDPAIYAEVLRDLAPDVVVLPESDTARLSSGGLDVSAYLSRATGLARVHEGPGITVLSRFPQASDAAMASSEGWSAQVALDVDGATVWVHGVHLARDSAERMRQAEAIIAASRANPGPRILAGDLNSCPTETCFGNRPSDGVYDLLAAFFDDTWTLHHGAEDPAGNTHPAWEPRRRIDVVMTLDLDVLSSQPVLDDRTRLGSDHLPVVAQLRVR